MGRLRGHLAPQHVQRIGELEVVGLAVGAGLGCRRRRADDGLVRVRLDRLAGEVAGKIGFARSGDLGDVVLVAGPRP